MELNIKMDRFDLRITENNIESSKIVNMLDICDVMKFLQSQIDILRYYKKGMKMGRDNMSSYIDNEGYYKGHNGMTCGDHDLDI